MAGGWLDERARNGGIDEVPLPSTGGRLWLCGKHLVGPDPAALLERTGASTIVCLNEESELRDRYPDYVRWLVTSPPSQALWFPVPDLHAPPVAVLRPVLTRLHARLDAGEGVIVHCGAGLGRAGTVAAALLVTMGTPLDDALASVAESRPLAGPQAGVQLDVLAELARTSPSQD